MINSISPEIGSGLLDMLRSLQKGQGEMLEESLSDDLTAQAMTIADSQTAYAGASSNLMSGNFAGATEKSRYIEADLAGRQAQQQMMMRSHQVLQAAAAGMLAANGIDASRPGSVAGAGMEMTRISNTKALEASRRNLDEIRENIEHKAEEAVRPTDENGNPVENTTEAAPLPEISGYNPATAPAPEMSAAPAPDVATIAVSAPEVATPSAPSVPSIDIMV